MRSRTWRIIGISQIILGVLALCLALFHLVQLPPGRYGVPIPLPPDHPYYAQLRWFPAVPLGIGALIAGVAVVQVSPRRPAARRALVVDGWGVGSATLAPPAGEPRQPRWHRAAVLAVRLVGLAVGLSVLALVVRLAADPNAQLRIPGFAILAIVFPLLIVGDGLRRAGNRERVSVHRSGRITINIED